VNCVGTMANVTTMDTTVIMRASAVDGLTSPYLCRPYTAAPSAISRARVGGG
jgi:hypothetical protein